MAENLIIETPEQVSLELPLAGIGSRFLALALDTLIQLAIGLALFLMWIGLGALGLWHASPKGNQRSIWMTALLVLAAFIVQFAYFAFFESIWNGQTPGKRYLHLRVIRRSGHPISAYEAVTRNLLRIVDSVPGVYAVGIVCALLNSESRRLGDYVAGTVVVHERASELTSEPGTLPSPGALVPGLLPAGTRLSSEEFLLVESFLARRHKLSYAVRDQLGRQIADRIAGRLGIPLQDRKRPEALLEELTKSYRA